MPRTFPNEVASELLHDPRAPYVGVIAYLLVVGLGTPLAAAIVRQQAESPPAASLEWNAAIPPPERSELSRLVDDNRRGWDELYAGVTPLSVVRARRRDRTAPHPPQSSRGDRPAGAACAV